MVRDESGAPNLTPVESNGGGYKTTMTKFHYHDELMGCSGVSGEIFKSVYKVNEYYKPKKKAFILWESSFYFYFCKCTHTED